jgi:hypothetical protein
VLHCWLLCISILASWLSVYSGRLAVLTMLFGFLSFFSRLAGNAVYVGCLILLAVCRLVIMVLLAGLPAILENFSE